MELNSTQKKSFCQFTKNRDIRSSTKTMLRKIIVPLIFVLICNSAKAQLTSLSFSYGIGGAVDLGNNMKFPSHQAHFDVNIFLARSISAGLNLNYRTINLNQYAVDSIPVPKWSALSIGLNLKWWILNDFRTGKKKGSKSKNTLKALTYPFRLYLVGDFGYAFNVQKGNPNLERGSIYAGGGLGANLWQFSPKRKRGVGSGTGKFFIIPFVAVVYNYFFKDYLVTEDQIWKPHNLDIKVGFRIAFDTY